MLTFCLFNCSAQESNNPPTPHPQSKLNRIPPDTIKTEGPCLSRGSLHPGGNWVLAQAAFFLRGAWAHRQIRNFMSECQRQTPPGRQGTAFAAATAAIGGCQQVHNICTMLQVLEGEGSLTGCLNEDFNLNKSRRPSRPSSLGSN